MHALLGYISTTIIIIIIIISDLGRRITNISGEARVLSFLFQRVSVFVQRFNAILLHDCMPAADRTD